MADHGLYRLDKSPIARGGQAEVIRAVHRVTGDVVALKRRAGADSAAADRMRREIEVQSSIQHLNVMPILDFDADDHRWFAMPLAESTLEDHLTPMGVDQLTQMVRDVASGLQVAHDSGFVHRDVKPRNVLKLNDLHGERWVIADWGIVRRPLGATTAQHTYAGMFLGTDGFAPPEAYTNSHDVDFSWDSYSLGRLAAWASTGTFPVRLTPSIAPEPWRRFVRVLTDANPRKRPQNMAQVLELLSRVTTQLPAVSGVPDSMLTAAKAGDSAATLAVLEAAHDYADDEDFFIDDVAELAGPGLDAYVGKDPDGAKRLLELMDTHLKQIRWGRRNFDHYNVPLHWMQRVAEAAGNAGELDLLEDACEVLFSHEPGLDRWRQKAQSRQWLASLEGEPARRAAQILTEKPVAAKFYGELKHAVDPGIRAALKAAAEQT
jgi:serine/threonine protein kinase